MGRVHLVRHGQASFGADDYDVLSDLGARQAARAGAVLPRDAYAISGTLRRHRDSAAAAGFAGAEADPAWNEFDYLDIIAVAHPGLGNMPALRAHLAHEPAPMQAFQALYEEAVARWMEADGNSYRESRRDFVTRVEGALERASGKGDAVVFTSGGVISALVAGLLDLTPAAARRIDRVLVNAGITTITTGRRGPQLLALNAQTHLQEDGLVTFR